MFPFPFYYNDYHKNTHIYILNLETFLTDKQTSWLHHHNIIIGKKSNVTNAYWFDETRCTKKEAS